jgi:hypothetical protein
MRLERRRGLRLMQESGAKESAITGAVLAAIILSFVVCLSWSVNFAEGFEAWGWLQVADRMSVASGKPSICEGRRQVRPQCQTARVQLNSRGLPDRSRIISPAPGNREEGTPRHQAQNLLREKALEIHNGFGGSNPVFVA